MGGRKLIPFITDAGPAGRGACVPTASPPRPHHSLPWGPLPAEPAPTHPGHPMVPRSRTMVCPKAGDVPSVLTRMPTATLNPVGWLHPCPEEEGKEWGAPAPFTPTSTTFWESLIPKS